MNNIISALSELTNLSTFCAKQTVEHENLTISIRDYPYHSGKLKFPLSGRGAKALIKLAKPAKFGWKDQTLLDLEVRDVWELSKNQVKIDNRQWNKTLRPLLNEFKEQLGLPATSQLKAHLHNLMIYEKGQFFKPHQDSEKLEGMVATLVVILPSGYCGGSLVVNHHEESKCFRQSRSKMNLLTLIAFYADCPHEVRPVTEGYRVVLTYNLVLSEAANTNYLSSTQSKTTQTLKDELQNYFYHKNEQGTDFDNLQENASFVSQQPANKWFYLLDYQYSQKSLGWNKLKSDDQIRVNTLQQIANELQLDCHLALADVHEIWDCEAEYDEWNYRHRSRNYWQRYDHDDSCEDEEKYTLNDLIDRDFCIKYGINDSRQTIDYANLNISSNQLCWTKAYDEFSPFESEYEGYMGNWGNTLDRWYHRATIILTRKQDRLAILIETSPASGIKAILSFVNSDRTQDETRQLVKNSLPLLLSKLSDVNNSKTIQLLFKLALKIDCKELAASLLSPFYLSVLTGRQVDWLLKLDKHYDTIWSLKLLQDWSQNEGYYYRSSAQCIKKLSQTIKKLTHSTKTSTQIIDWLLNDQIVRFEKHNIEQQKSSRVYIKQEEKNRNQYLLDLLLACHFANNSKYQRQLLTFIKNNNSLYSMYAVTDIIKSLLNSLSIDDFIEGGFAPLFNLTIKRLNKKIEKGMRRKDDWSMAESSSCDCEDCATLNRFLSSNNQTELRWPINKQRRQHQHQNIDGLGIAVSHLTERKGSPFVLVLNKTTQLFIDDKKQMQKTQKYLVKLKTMVSIQRILKKNK